MQNKRPHGLPHPLVVSLTSYPPRYPTLVKTLRSLLDQNMQADHSVLWIASGDLAALPDEVRALERHGLSILPCEDIRSYKKLVPALLAFPDACVVTADDDLYYPPDWLAQLVDRSRAAPGCVVAHRAHMAFQRADGSLRPYREWEMAAADQGDRLPDGLLFPTGVGGVLYPPGGFDPRVTDQASFMELCPRADDVWFFWMAELAGTPHKGIGSGLPPLAWDGSQDVGLFHANWLGGENDPQITAMQHRFGTLRTPDG